MRLHGVRYGYSHKYCQLLLCAVLDVTTNAAASGNGTTALLQVLAVPVVSTFMSERHRNRRSAVFSS